MGGGGELLAFEYFLNLENTAELQLCIIIIIIIIVQCMFVLKQFNEMEDFGGHFFDNHRQ